MELVNSSGVECLLLPDDTKPHYLTLTCEFPRVIMGGTCSHKSGTDPLLFVFRVRSGLPSQSSHGVVTWLFVWFSYRQEYLEGSNCYL